MSTNMFDLLKELGLEPGKEDSQCISVLAHVDGELLAYRKKHRLTQKQLAESLGVTQAMVSKLESGDTFLFNSFLIFYLLFVFFFPSSIFTNFSAPFLCFPHLLLNTSIWFNPKEGFLSTFQNVSYFIEQIR